MIKSWLNFCLAILTAGSFYGHQAAQGTLISAEPVPGEDALSGSYSIVVEGYDWGSAVSGAILHLDGEIEEISPEQFLVVEEKQARENSSVDMFATSGALTIARAERTVTNAYLCDEQGNPTKSPSSYVALELEVGPDIGSPVCFHSDEQHYRWADPYRLVIELAPDQTITSKKTEYARLAIARTATQRIMPLADRFEIAQYTADGHTFSYASYCPPTDGDRHPLVIWLHGLGEGGTDATMPLLGGNVTTFADTEFQRLMDDAYVLVPQCPTFWMDDGTGYNTRTGESGYTEGLMALIRHFAGSYPGIDPDRIYIGGCSNGGYMTLALLLEDPDFFAAAFPTCEAYQDNWLSEKDIQTLKDIPIWFTHSELDQVCPPSQSTFPTVERLLAAGANNVKLIRLQEIHDTSGLYQDKQGLPYRYNPHYAWIRVLNDPCTDPTTGQNLFQWLANQSRAN